MPKTYVIPPATTKAACDTCRAPVYWIVTDAGKRMPASVNVALDPTCIAPTPSTAGVGVSHFADCPDAAKHRRSR